MSESGYRRAEFNDKNRFHRQIHFKPLQGALLNHSPWTLLTKDYFHQRMEIIEEILSLFIFSAVKHFFSTVFGGTLGRHPGQR